MVKCSRCGVEIDDSFNQCPNCGNDLTDNHEDDCSVEISKNVICSQCGLEISDDLDFCPNCGNSLNNIQIVKCDECGSQLGENDLICSVCGSKINYPKLCSNCGNPVDKDAEFCEECGQNIHSHKSEVIPQAEENLKNVSKEVLSILDRIILFFKQLFVGNS